MHAPSECMCIVIIASIACFCSLVTSQDDSLEEQYHDKDFSRSIKMVNVREAKANGKYVQKKNLKARHDQTMVRRIGTNCRYTSQKKCRENCSAGFCFDLCIYVAVKTCI